MSAPQAAEKWGISERRVQILCQENRILGVSKLGYIWLIPKNAEKPKDSRKKQTLRKILIFPYQNPMKDFSLICYSINNNYL